MEFGFLDSVAIEEIATGAAILGAGGGGDPTLGMLMARHAIEEHGPIRLVRVEDVPEDEWIVPLSVVGAPTVTIEKIASGTEILAALEMIEQHLGMKTYGVFPGEIGGGNSMTPLHAAARSGLPVVDCDLMGRAFPEIQMTTGTLAGIAASPMSMADEKGTRILINGIDNVWTERIARVATVQMGGCSHIANYCMRGRQAKVAVIPGTISLARTIGRALRTSKSEKSDPVERLVGLLDGILICRGKISDVQRRTERGFAFGEVSITVSRSQSMVRVAFQNENLVAWQDGEVRVTVPDLITIVDESTGRAIMTEQLKYGQRVAVLGIPCHPKWRSPQGLKLVGPKYFGYDIEYTPLRAAHV